MVSIEEQNEKLYLLHRSYSGAVIFSGLILGKLSKIKEIDGNEK